MIVEVGAQLIVLNEIKPTGPVVGKIGKQIDVGLIVVMVPILFVMAGLTTVAGFAST